MVPLRSSDGNPCGGVFPLLAGIFVLLFSSWAGALYADDRVEAVMAGIKRNYASLPALSIPYERDVVTRSMAMLDDNLKSDVATGTLHIQPPHFLRIDQETPRAEQVISDGETLWWYVPSKKEAYRYTSDRVGRELGLLGDVFQGLKEVEDDFKIEITAFGREGHHELKLTPTPPWPDIEAIRITVRQDDLTIREVAIHNYLGGYTRFILGDFVVREGFDTAFFSFSPPEDVRVIREQASGLP